MNSKILVQPRDVRKKFRQISIVEKGNLWFIFMFESHDNDLSKTKNRNVREMKNEKL